MKLHKVLELLIIGSGIVGVLLLLYKIQLILEEACVWVK